MARQVRFKVGRQRLDGNVRPSQANYTRQIREQMKVIEDNLMRVIKGIEGLTPEALEYGVQPIYDKSQVYVPVKTGDLKVSGFVDSGVTSRGARVVVSYGKGGKPEYAVFVHEMVDFQHDAPTQAKFLEYAVDEHINEVAPRVAKFIKDGIGL